MKWRILTFNDDHNHDLLPDKFTNFIAAFSQRVPAADTTLMEKMKQVGIPATRVFDFLAVRKGGYEKLGYRKKDIYNYLGMLQRSLTGQNDADRALSYMSGKEANDPNFFYAIDLDEQEKLSRLIWIDDGCRSDYASFGDVALMDATYKTNLYGQPLIVIGGVSNHHNTLLFATGLLHDETEASYVWFLQKFREGMGNSAPKCLITDGDTSMALAIEQVFPETRHRLCGWHLSRNADTHVKIPGFHRDFHQLVYTPMTEMAFETEWHKMLAKYGLDVEKGLDGELGGQWGFEEGQGGLEEGDGGLEKDPLKKAKRWLKAQYSRRSKWAATFFRGVFCAEARTTQRIEGLNAQIKNQLVRGSSMKLITLLRYADILLQKARQTNFEAEYKAISTLVHKSVTVLKQIENNARKIYTPSSMERIQKLIGQVGATIVTGPVRSETSNVYSVKDCDKFSFAEWTVEYNKATSEVNCDCLYFETVGFPCEHSFAVMKYEHLQKIPDNLVNNRWTMRPVNPPSVPTGIPTEAPSSLHSQYASILSAAVAAGDDATFKKALHELNNLGNLPRHTPRRTATSPKKTAENPRNSTKKRTAKKNKSTRKRPDNKNTGQEFNGLHSNHLPNKTQVPNYDDLPSQELPPTQEDITTDIPPSQGDTSSDVPTQEETSTDVPTQGGTATHVNPYTSVWSVNNNPNFYYPSFNFLRSYRV